MASNALARRDVQLARSRAAQTTARVRARADDRIAAMKSSLKRLKESNRVQMGLGAGLAAAGGVASGQVARMQLIPTAEGVSRAPILNFALGLAGGFALVSGGARTRTTMALAAVGVGMGVGQLAITSYLQWDLIPGDIFGA